MNRDRELAQLDDLLAEADAAPGPVVAVLSGMRGVGKSAMGSYWANGIRTRFSDGDLSVDFSKRRRDGGTAVSDLLAEFIRELEASEFAMPQTLPERAKVFGRITASRKLLVLLDDVASATEIKPLLPTGAGSVVVVTSNSHLEELLHEGATLIDVDPLDDHASRTLLGQMCGRERIEHEPDQTARLLEICGGLPVALCICGARLARHRRRSVAWLVTEIADEAQRLGGLSGEGGSVEAVFDFAYADLTETEALLYRRLASHPGRDLTVAHGAALANLPLAETERTLESLEDAHLFEPSHGEYYRQHDLLRIHARGCAERDDVAAAREAAVRRLVDWYYASLCKADRSLVEERFRLAEPARLDLPGMPSFDSRAEVFAWFDAERPNIMAVLRAAAEREWDDRIWQMGEALWLMLFNRQTYADWIEAADAGVDSAKRSGDSAAEARMRALRARAYHDLGEYDRALPELREALTTAESSGVRILVASIHEFLGTLHMSQSNYDEAIGEYGEARQFFVDSDLDRGTAIQDYHLGAALTRKGEPAKALGPLTSAVSTMREIDDELNVGRAMLYLGQAQLADGRPDEARATLKASIEITARLGVRHAEAQAYETLAEISEGDRQSQEAARYRRRAYEAYRQIGHPRAEALVEAAD